ncbi:MAG: hypothetical protein IT436_06175 [Phycisphaerales bacterium]|nr:hypothetical protein [Phycisphaerales bacterium]
MKIRSMLTAMVTLSAAAGAAHAQGLLVPDWTGDRVMLLNAFDGSVINASFIVDPAAGGGHLSSPKEAMQVGSEIWVSDQIGDGIFRYSATGAYLGTVAGSAQGLDNIRGFEVTADHVYVTCGSGTYSGQVAQFTLAGAFVRSFRIPGTGSTSPFDVKLRGDELLVSDSTTDDVDRFSLDGAHLGTLISSTGAAGDLDFAQQIYIRPSDGHLFVAGFSPDDGIYEYTSDGTELAVYAAGTGPRGGYILGNGDLLWTNGDSASVYSFGSGTSTAMITGVNAQYINPTTIPAPAAASLLAVAGLAGLRRRR